jgi:hypothetical protein
MSKAAVADLAPRAAFAARLDDRHIAAAGGRHRFAAFDLLPLAVLLALPDRADAGRAAVGAAAGAAITTAHDLIAWNAALAGALFFFAAVAGAFDPRAVAHAGVAALLIAATRDRARLSGVAEVALIHAIDAARGAAAFFARDLAGGAVDILVDLAIEVVIEPVAKLFGRLDGLRTILTACVHAPWPAHRGVRGAPNDHLRVTATVAVNRVTAKNK